MGPESHARSDPPRGHLETAHLCWATVAALDLGAALFTESERDEVRAAVRDKGVTLCLRGLDGCDELDHQRCILNAGVAVGAAVLVDATLIERCEGELARQANLWRPDGSCGESLQYGSYAALGMVLAIEALGRREASYFQRAPLAAYAGMVRWNACSLLGEDAFELMGPGEQHCVRCTADALSLT